MSSIASASVVEKKGYRNFGSFHTANVEDMIRTDDDDYRPPEIPLECRISEIEKPESFGLQCKQFFNIDFNIWTFVNHGAFGGVCKPSYLETEKWRLYCERQPLKFLDRELFAQLVRVMRELAAFINARPQDIVLLPNATSGLNAVLKSSQLGQGDVLYMLDIGYGSVKKMACALCPGVEVVYGNVKFPLSGPEAILQLVADSMPANTKLAVFDSVTSNTALVLPIRELIQLCHSRNIRVLVDGAHALGQLDVNMADCPPDFFVSNCHKWLCGPRGSAVLWVDPAHQAQIQPLVVSHGSGFGFTSNFIWDGCRDYSPFLGLSSTLRMWTCLGPAAVRSYMAELRAAAVEELVLRWETDTLAGPNMCASMALVKLPTSLCEGEGNATSTEAAFIQDLLHFHHHIECPIKCIEGNLYVRLSVHIYNTMEDYLKLADAVLAIAKSKDMVKLEP